jgi:hypothetical protein
MTDRVPDKETDERKVPCEVYSRIVGYLRPVQDWNKGKQQEFRDRATYDVEARTQAETVAQACDVQAK